MQSTTPYTYIQCPCSDSSTLSRFADPSSPPELDTDGDDDRTFDPRAPRSNYSLYPLEYLLYCEDCHQIRCQRCVAEEIVTYYCPSCLFEVPTGNIKSDGNRCTRSCFQCPICISPLSVTSLDSTPNPNLLAADNAAAPPGGPYTLTCSYCYWSSTEVGLKFDKPNGIYAQLQRIRNGGKPRASLKEKQNRGRKESSATGSGSIGNDSSSVLHTLSTHREASSPPSSSASPPPTDLDVESHFSNLKSFYQSQLSAANPGTTGLTSLGDLGFNSPGSLSRIMSLYTTGNMYDKKAKARATVMREALDAEEGLRVAQVDDREAITQLRQGGWDGTASAEQHAAQPPNVVEAAPPSGHGVGGSGRFVADLRPVPCLLRTKRSKRCPVCRHIISKPESKIASTRFRIRLVAGSYVPSISIRPLQIGTPVAAAGSSISQQLLAPLKPVQYLVTFKNPIFETVKVTLASPATTPGRFASKVTVLCPQFEIDANTDVWDEALKDDDKDRRRRGDESGGGGGHNQPEAGKIWQRGRNWVSIVVEVVPASLSLDALALTKTAENHVDLGPLGEDEDVLEIPMFVRVEWEADPSNDDVGTAPGKDRDAKEKRELAYWSVLGIGRIAQD